MYGHSSPQPIVTTTSTCSASSRGEQLRPAIGYVDAELAHDFYDLGMDVLGGCGAGGPGVVVPVGGALEQRLAHLRATGVMQTDEQDGCHRQG